TGTVSFYQPVDVFQGSIAGRDYDMSGVIGGAQLGYNFQAGNFVFGIEADISGTGIKGTVTDPDAGYRVTSRLDWLATVRGRVGMAFDRVFLYGTGGLAVGRVKATLDDFYDDVTVTTN